MSASWELLGTGEKSRDSASNVVQCIDQFSSWLSRLAQTEQAAVGVAFALWLFLSSAGPLYSPTFGPLLPARCACIMISCTAVIGPRVVGAKISTRIYIYDTTTIIMCNRYNTTCCISNSLLCTKYLVHMTYSRVHTIPDERTCCDGVVYFVALTAVHLRCDVMPDLQYCTHNGQVYTCKLKDKTKSMNGAKRRKGVALHVDLIICLVPPRTRYSSVSV